MRSHWAATQINTGGQPASMEASSLSSWGEERNPVCTACCMSHGVSPAPWPCLFLWKDMGSGVEVDSVVPRMVSRERVGGKSI